MNYGYGPGATGPYSGPSWWQAGWGGFPGYGGYPWYGGMFANPFFGYGTFPYWSAMYPGAWGVPNDAEIKYFVENSLDNDPTIPAHVNIGVEVQNGVVTLTGTVPNKRIKHAAGDDAWWIPQVIDVHNEIQVMPRRERAAGAEGVRATTGRRTQATAR